MATRFYEFGEPLGRICVLVADNLTNKQFLVPGSSTEDQEIFGRRNSCWLNFCVKTIFEDGQPDVLVY